jgi:hypothetical protein
MQMPSVSSPPIEWNIRQPAVETQKIAAAKNFSGALN